MGQVAIYALYDTGAPLSIRYIGQSVDPRGRLWEHVISAKQARSKTEKQAWLWRVINSGRGIACDVIEWVSVERADQAEAYWLQEMLRRGHALTNCNTLDGMQGDYAPACCYEMPDQMPHCVYPAKLETKLRVMFQLGRNVYPERRSADQPKEAALLAEFIERHAPWLAE